MQSVDVEDPSARSPSPESQNLQANEKSPSVDEHGRVDDEPETKIDINEESPSDKLTNGDDHLESPSLEQQDSDEKENLEPEVSTTETTEPSYQTVEDGEVTPVAASSRESNVEDVLESSPDSAPDVNQIPPPSPPTPPAKFLEESPSVNNEIVNNASLQEVTLDAPPAPIEKSPRDAHTNITEVTQSSRPSTPLTARLFGRKSTSESVHSPSSSLGHVRNLTITQGHTLSVVLISNALETIAGSREAKRSAPLKDAVDNALTMIRSGQGGDRPREIFEPLRLACETGNEKLQIASLDCISKLISYSFFLETDAPASHHIASPPPSPALPPQKFTSESQTNLRPPTLVDLVTHTITACHTETTPDTVSLQIVKALLALVLSPTLLVHQSSLLKAVRTVYNIFLLSPDPINQTVAQGGLTQMVHHVFARCKLSGLRNDFVDISSPISPRPDGYGQGIRLPSNRPSLTPTTPDTYPLPPLTPPNGPDEEEEAAQKRENTNITETPVSQADKLPEGEVQSPGPGGTSLYV